MARRHFGINTVNIMKTNIAAGTSGDSDPVDIRELSRTGDISVSYTVAPITGVATAGTAVLSYSGCGVYDGTYVTLGTFGTSTASTGGSDIVSITPPPVPFLKFHGSCGTSAGINVAALLHAR